MCAGVSVLLVVIQGPPAALSPVNTPTPSACSCVSGLGRVDRPDKERLQRRSIIQEEQQRLVCISTTTKHQRRSQKCDATKRRIHNCCNNVQVQFWWGESQNMTYSVVFLTWGGLCPGQETAGPVRCPPPHSPAGGAQCPGCCVSGWWRRLCSRHQSDWEFHSDPPAAAPHRRSRTDPACAAESWAGWLLPPAGRQRQHSSGSTSAADFCQH